MIPTSRIEQDRPRWEIDGRVFLERFIVDNVGQPISLLTNVRLGCLLLRIEDRCEVA